MGLFLKLSKGINAPLFKPELSCANQTTWAIPVIVERDLDWRIKAISMVAVFTAIANEYRRMILSFSTSLTYLINCQPGMKSEYSTLG